MGQQQLLFLVFGIVVVGAVVVAGAYVLKDGRTLHHRNMVIHEALQVVGDVQAWKQKPMLLGGGAGWLLMELVDNHVIAKQMGNMAASNTALGLIAKHKMVDAFAAEEIVVTTTKEIVERIARGRERMNKDNVLRLVPNDVIEHEGNDLFAAIPLAKPGIF